MVGICGVGRGGDLRGNDRRVQYPEHGNGFISILFPKQTKEGGGIDGRAGILCGEWE